MPRNLESLFARETAKAAQSQLFHLVEIQYPYIDRSDQGGMLYLVDSNYDVHLGGQLYAKFPLKFNGASMNSDGSIDQASLSIANVSREIMYYVEKCDGMRGMRVKVKIVYANALDYIYTPNDDGTVSTEVNPLADADAYVEDEYLIDNYTANETVVSFQLFPIIDLEIKLPRRRYMTDSCYWIYGDKTTCKYDLENVNAQLNCKKTLDDCKEHKKIVPLEGCTAHVSNPSILVRITSSSPFTIPSDKVVGGKLVVNNIAYKIAGYGPATSTEVWLTLEVPYAGPTDDRTDFYICTTEGNEPNFGGFPGVSGSRRVFL